MLVAFARDTRDSTFYERAVSDRLGMRGVNPTRPAQVDAGRLLVVNADRIGQTKADASKGTQATVRRLRRSERVSAPEVK